MKRVFIILLLFTLVFSLCGCGSARISPQTISVTGSVEESGVVQFPLFNGKFLQYTNYDTKTALISPDRSRVAFLDGYGVLKTTEKGKSELQSVASNAHSILNLYNDGVIYLANEDGNYSLHCYSFSTQKDVATGVTYTKDYATNLYSSTLQIAFFDDSGSVYYYNASLEEPQKISSYSGYPVFLGISPKGNSMVWVDIGSEKEAVFCYENGEMSRLCEYPLTSSSASSVSVTFHPSGTYYSVCSVGSPVIYLKKQGEAPIKYDVGQVVKLTDVFTKNGLLREESDETIEGIYIVAGGGESAFEGRSLFFLDASGGASLVTSGKYGYILDSGHLYYGERAHDTKLTSTIYLASISRDSLGTPEKIASSVDDYFAVGDYLYYSSSYLAGFENVKVKKAGAAAIEIPGAKAFRYISTDGKTVYFFKDICNEKIGSVTLSYGSLYSFTYGDSTEKLIDSNVLTESLHSGVYRVSVLGDEPMIGRSYLRQINSSSFVYRVFKLASSNSYTYGYKYYNGKDSMEIAKQAIQIIE